MPSPIRDGANLFHDEPDEFASGIEATTLHYIENGEHGLLEGLLPYLEEEAIARLRHAGATVCLMDEAHLKKHDRDRWRIEWVTEARYFERHWAGTVNAPPYAAAKMLIFISDLRYAIEDGHAEKAAALGMLVTSWAFMGGVALRLATAEPVAKKYKASQRGKARLERTTLEAGSERTRKTDLVARSLRMAGSNAGTNDVWPHLWSLLDAEGFSPVEDGAKDQKKMLCTDANGVPVIFTFKGVQTMLAKLRGTKARRGRPKKKPD